MVCNSNESNLTIGVANELFEKESIPEYGYFWGISPYSCTKVTPNAVDNFENVPFKNGDRLGVLLEYRGSTASLRFFINDGPLDVEIDGLSGPLYPVVSFMSSLGNVTLEPNAKLPPSF